MEKIRPEPSAGPEARDVDAFLRGPPVHPLLFPARALPWRRAAQTAYAAPPPEHIVRAMSRLGPGSHPAPYKVGP